MPPNWMDLFGLNILLCIIHNIALGLDRNVEVPSHLMPDEKRLLDKLMLHYEKSARPVLNASHPVRVELGLTLTHIFDMDEKNQVLTANVWLDQEWHDELLSWNPNDYNGLSVMRIPCQKLWLPDIVLYNNADDYTAGYMESKAMVTHIGRVFWPPPTKLRSTCKVDVTYFPFDEQECKLKFGSWTYDGFQVDIINRTTEVDLTNYVRNGEWELVFVLLERNVVTYSCCVEPFPDVTFTIRMRRRTLYYMYNVIFPCMMMSALTLLVFCLPPDSGEKIALGITVLLAFSVFMLAIAEKMPETSEFVPLIGIYLTVVMTMTSISVVMTVIVLNFHHRGPVKKEVPGWMRKVVLERLARCLCMKPTSVDGYYDASDAHYMRNVSLRLTIENMHDELKESENMDHSNLCTDSSPTVDSNNQYHKRGSRYRNKVQEKILKTLQILISRQEQEEQNQDIVNEWRQIAQVIDRFLFWIFLIATTTSSLGILVLMPLGQRKAIEAGN